MEISQSDSSVFSVVSESLPVVFIIDDVIDICEILHEEFAENVNAKIEIFTKPLDVIKRIEKTELSRR